MIYKEADYSLLRFAFTRHHVFFVFIHLFILGGPPYLVWQDQWHWMFAVVEGLALALYWTGTYFHRRRLQRLNAKGSGSPHVLTVCEGCNPICMVDENRKFAGPVTNMVWWYAAAANITREHASDVLDSMANGGNPSAYEVICDRYAEYLDHPKFRKFKTK